MDLEGDGSLGEVWLRVNETEAESLDEFTRLTNCTLPQPRKCVYMYIHCIVFIFACILVGRVGEKGKGKRKRKERERERERREI